MCLIGTIRLYQLTLSPLLGPKCRFEPTCSHYMVQSVKKYGLVRGFNQGTAPVSALPSVAPRGI